MNVRDLATGGDPRKAMAEQFFKSEQAEAFLSIVAHRERRIMEAVADLQEAVDDEDVEPLEGLPSVDDRVGQIRSMALAMVDDSLPSWYVEEAIDIENAGEAAQYADLTPEEWQTTKETWAERYREQDLEGSVEELATAHVRTRFDVEGLEEFREAVVEWPTERQKAVLEEALAGGLQMAEQGINEVAEGLEG
ncbi:hypothetical protein [Natrinema versiforme]|uniref:Uncharacterized protein n=2 Tax=root TaxID=1 RepID=A0A4V1G0E9_9EURY|nr:hypothetical protein [Natrinema versiforme]YP_010772684.1 putative viral structural protein [Natrinema versiforme icosahedral virus 1]QCS45106.1 hypothetical protein FEJ81_22820 [Natrinema versiforme]DAC85267.1 TPA_asm: putative viral structural protein [Natrinema versiforme icosahedral virus 1]